MYEYRVPTRKPRILDSCTPTHHRTHDFPSFTTPTHHRTHAKSAKNTVPIATPTITPTLHPHYTHLTPTLHPRAISVCRKNVCKNVCVSKMYVDLYVIQLTVLLLDYCTPAEHPHLHPCNFGEPGIRNTHTRGFPYLWVLPIPTPESKNQWGPTSVRRPPGLMIG